MAAFLMLNVMPGKKAKQFQKRLLVYSLTASEGKQSSSEIEAYQWEWPAKPRESLGNNQNVTSASLGSAGAEAHEQGVEEIDAGANLKPRDRKRFITKGWVDRREKMAAIGGR